MFEKKTPVLIARIIIELLSLFLAVVLFINHKLQLWLVIFAVSALLSVFFSRFYCGWICPMNTFFRIIDVIYRRIGIKRLKTPVLLQNNVLRILLLVLFIAVMVITKIMGIKVNVLIIITAFSVLLTLIFEEALWHRRLCPFGTILSLTSRKSIVSLRIDEQDCIACGKCQKVCPVDSISTLENKKRQNIISECILCGNCRNICPKNVCRYEKG